MILPWWSAKAPRVPSASSGAEDADKESRALLVGRAGGVVERRECRAPLSADDLRGRRQQLAELPQRQQAREFCATGPPSGAPVLEDRGSVRLDRKPPIRRRN